MTNKLHTDTGIFKGRLGDATPPPPKKKTFAIKCHLKRRLTGRGSSWKQTDLHKATLILFTAQNLLYQMFFKQNVLVYFFACDAINLMVSCSLLAFMQKLFYC